MLLHADHTPQSPREWEQWVRTTEKALSKQSVAYRRNGKSDEATHLRLVHAQCRRRLVAGGGAKGTALLPACEPLGLA